MACPMSLAMVDFGQLVEERPSDHPPPARTASAQWWQELICRHPALSTFQSASDFPTSRAPNRTGVHSASLVSPSPLSPLLSSPLLSLPPMHVQCIPPCSALLCSSSLLFRWSFRTPSPQQFYKTMTVMRPKIQYLDTPMQPPTVRLTHYSHSN